MKTNFEISQSSKFSAKVQVCDSGQNLIMTKTSYITVNEEKLKENSLYYKKKIKLKKFPIFQ